MVMNIILNENQYKVLLKYVNNNKNEIKKTIYNNPIKSVNYEKVLINIITLGAYGNFLKIVNLSISSANKKMILKSFLKRKLFLFNLTFIKFEKS